MPEYPEHEKVRALENKNQAVGEFLEWLGTQEIYLAKKHEHSEYCMGKERYYTCGYMKNELQAHVPGIEALLAQFFEIDLKKLAAEKDAMVKELQDAARKGPKHA